MRVCVCVCAYVCMYVCLSVYIDTTDRIPCVCVCGLMSMVIQGNHSFGHSSIYEPGPVSQSQSVGQSVTQIVTQIISKPTNGTDTFRVPLGLPVHLSHLNITLTSQAYHLNITDYRNI